MTISKKAHHDPHQPSPALGHLVPHPPNTPPPRENSTTHESDITDFNGNDITDFNGNVASAVCDSERDHTMSEESVEDASSM